MEYFRKPNGIKISTSDFQICPAILGNHFQQFRTFSFKNKLAHIPTMNRFRGGTTSLTMGTATDRHTWFA